MITTDNANDIDEDDSSSTQPSKENHSESSCWLDLDSYTSDQDKSTDEILHNLSKELVGKKSHPHQT